MARILLIDDDDLVRTSIAKALMKEGYDLVLAGGSEQGTQMAKKEEFDLIISDIRMPGKNGVELVNEVQAYYKTEKEREVPIIFITGYPGDRLQLHADFLGEVILKPFDISRLLIAIREYL